MSLRPHVALFFCLLAGTTVWAQPEVKYTDQFYTSRAKADGIYEQNLVFQSEKDEWDFWKDQRLYERHLLRKDPQRYTAYILSKREVYATHKALCDSQCRHGDYYFIQAAYYLQFTEGDALNLTLQNTEVPEETEPALFVRN